MKRLLLLALLLPLPAQADDSWLIIGSSAADLASTEYALSHDSRLSETNPFLRDQARRYALKAAATAVLVYVYKQIDKQHPRGARVFAIVVSAVFIAAAGWNMSQAGGF